MKKLKEKPVTIIFGVNSSFGAELVESLSPLSDVFTVSRSAFPNVSDHFMISDYSDDELSKICKTIRAHPSSVISVLILNGIADSGALYRLPESEVDGIIEVNLKVPIRITRIFIKELLFKEVSFFYFSSSRALATDVGISVYSATKSGLTNFAKCCAAEYGKLRKYFFVISFGVFDGGLYTSLSSHVRESLRSRTSIPGFIDIEQLSRTIFFHISNSSATGSVLKVDNGFF